MDNAYKYISRNGGIDTEESYQYIGKVKNNYQLICLNIFYFLNILIKLNIFKYSLLL